MIAMPTSPAGRSSIDSTALCADATRRSAPAELAISRPGRPHATGR
jgi:hypothetical protein